MGVQTAGYLDAIEHLPDGATLLVHQCAWEEYERLLEDLRDRPHLRVSYDSGTLAIRSPLPEHEYYARFIDQLVGALGDALDLAVQSFGSATWKRRRLAKGVEPDACFYVASAPRVIGKVDIDLEVDPPPDLVVEIDVTHESLRKFAIYAALGVPEIWRYDTAQRRVSFHGLAGGAYEEIPQSRFFEGLTPGAIGAALEQSKTEGQTVALRTFRERWRQTA
jgi:Uma2 family endonuclease